MSDVTTYVSEIYRNNTEYNVISRPGHSGNGLGYGNEGLFQVKENNSSGADIPELNLELKSSASDSNTLMTLFTKVPTINCMSATGKGASRYLTETYGQPVDEDGRNNFYYSLKVGKITNVGDSAFTLVRDDTNLWVVADDTRVAGWKLDTIEKAARKKIGGGSKIDGHGAVLLSKGKATQVDPSSNLTNCVFSKATLYQGFSWSSFVDALDNKDITVDFRSYSRDVGKKNLKIRERGTAFRISETNMSDLFDSTEVIFTK